MSNYLKFIHSKNRSQDEHYMKIALEAAEASKSQGEQARGAVLVLPNRVFIETQSVISTGDPTALAEINVIRKVAPLTRNLQDAILYTTTEPSTLGMAAVIQSGIKELVWGAYDKVNGFNTANKLNLGGVDVKYLGGVLAESCYNIASPSLKEHLKYETSVVGNI